MRRKSIILSQNRYFHSAFGGFASWNLHQGSALDPLGGEVHNAPKPPAAKGPQTILCPTFQFSKVGKYAEQLQVTASVKIEMQVKIMTSK